jgi:hypothetical protein
MAGKEEAEHFVFIGGGMKYFAIKSSFPAKKLDKARLNS